MNATEPLRITLPHGRRVDVQVGRHVVHTDQPVDNGGEDTAPSPFELFLASLGACAGIFVQGFCAARKLPTEGIALTEVPTFGADGVLERVALRLELPAGFPERYREPLERVVAQCSVKKAIAAQPDISVEVTVGQSAA